MAGKASYYEVLEAQQQLFPAQLNLARTQRDQFAVVSLYKALGGVWRDEFNAIAASSGVVNERQTFNPLFPVVRTSRAALIGPANHIDLHPSLGFERFVLLKCATGRKRH